MNDRRDAGSSTSPPRLTGPDSTPFERRPRTCRSTPTFSGGHRSDQCNAVRRSCGRASQPVSSARHGDRPNSGRQARSQTGQNRADSPHGPPGSAVRLCLDEPYSPSDIDRPSDGSRDGSCPLRRRVRWRFTVRVDVNVIRTRRTVVDVRCSAWRCCVHPPIKPQQRAPTRP